MTFRPELEIWVQTIPCELRLDCELAMLHYHVSDQVFYDMDEVNAVYPDGLPIMQPEDKKYLHVSELGSTSDGSVEWDGSIVWDGRVGSMVYRRDPGGGELIPIGIATGQGTVDDRFDPPNWSPTVSVMTSGIVSTAALASATSGWTSPSADPLKDIYEAMEEAQKNRHITHRPAIQSLPQNYQPRSPGEMVLPPDPNIQPGDQVTVHGTDGSRKDYSVVGTMGEGGLVINYDKSPEELDDASLFRMRERMMNGLSINFPMTPPFLGNY